MKFILFTKTLEVIELDEFPYRYTIYPIGTFIYDITRTETRPTAWWRMSKSDFGGPTSPPGQS